MRKAEEVVQYGLHFVCTVTVAYQSSSSVVSISAACSSRGRSDLQTPDLTSCLPLLEHGACEKQDLLDCVGRLTAVADAIHALPTLPDVYCHCSITHNTGKRTAVIMQAATITMKAIKVPRSLLLTAVAPVSMTDPPRA